MRKQGMTALNEFSRLESPGLWRSAPGAQRRDVVVSFGEATLVLSDMAGRPLAHWSLPAVERINPGRLPAMFSPDPERSETLEIEEDLMVEALGKVQRAIARSGPRPGKLRLMIAALMAATLALLGVYWLPAALVGQSMAAMRPVTAQEIDKKLLDEITLLIGPPCAAPSGIESLTLLRTRLGLQGTIHVLPGELPHPLQLPGGMVLLDRAMVELPDDPAIAAGYVLEAVSEGAEAMPQALARLGVGGNLSLLATGHIRAADGKRLAREMIGQSRNAPDPTRLAAAFDAARVPMRPWALHDDITGTQHAAALAITQAPEATPQILPDAKWIALQNICEG